MPVPSDAVPAGREDLLGRAKAIGEAALSHQPEAEANRRLADPVIEAIVSSGLLKMLRPRRLGGIESDPVTYVEVIREIGRRDVNASWLYGVLSIHDWFMAYTGERLQEDVWGTDPDALVVDSLAPMGTAVPQEGGYVVTGRWRFVSGVEWCSWVAVNAITTLPDGQEPEPVIFFVPRAELRVEDDWHVVGLRGTASNAVVLDGCFVPEHRLMPFGRVAASGRPQGPVLDDGPLYRVPFIPMLATGLFPPALGGGQQALDRFHEWTEGRIRPFSQGAQAREMPAAQYALAECATRWDAAHALALRYAAEVYELGQQGVSALDDFRRARFFAWRSWIVRTSAEIADRLFLDSGGNALRADHPMQQAWRDTHAAAQHVSIVYSDAMTSRGQTQFGFPGHPLI
jgi:3-hydroxy-9,10-secoandrosta-1,3,5(10)-triene-9,17-dione monooxygenase